MSDTKTTKIAVVKDEIIELSNKLVAGMALDKDTGIGTEIEAGKLYEDNLPDGLTMKEVKLKADYDTKFVAAAAHAAGVMSIEAMKANPNLNETSFDFRIGVRDELNVGTDRRREYTNRLGGAEETIVKHGDMRTKYVNKAASQSAGQLKIVRQSIAALAMETLSK